MNIFILDEDMQKCAEYHADQHVVKMILESTQILCTALNENGIIAPYKSTHVNHPCTLWTGKSLSNWIWLRNFTLKLNEEFKFRFNHKDDHKSAKVTLELKEPPIPDLGLTEFAQAMPEKYRVPGNAVKAYRSFYIGEKSGFTTWTKRSVPAWFEAGFQDFKRTIK
ncbi:MAG: pyrimidine dimer DNA glycosylase/endonuclease V [Candidatus Cloacimonetes bacterium]|nr:pyrimidine dimer DNA glycosylase/endonuclease V [Candidatus Cloacimonadota bacterium]MCF7813972.1 pyrimidine dimer DNA glycosylase/endonuclease V [Candidatus Cloacimonadota bacterium]MCF7868816.1 pyrimidine dimer DNA glycosylase/endonuclease V [Candidatus Cloacimonadota bacterium]MCF7884075.1 pyrimidine dimer DNA glycosylase/endonuclease V [Candidatus Cloacimonadota bacterium]